MCGLVIRDERTRSTPERHHPSLSLFFFPWNPKSPNRFPVIHRADGKLFTLPHDLHHAGSQSMYSLCITKGLVNIMDTVEHGTAET